MYLVDGCVCVRMYAWCIQYLLDTSFSTLDRAQIFVRRNERLHRETVRQVIQTKQTNTKRESETERQRKSNESTHIVLFRQWQSERVRDNFTVRSLQNEQRQFFKLPLPPPPSLRIQIVLMRRNRYFCVRYSSTGEHFLDRTAFILPTFILTYFRREQTNEKARLNFLKLKNLGWECWVGTKQGNQTLKAAGVWQICFD